MSAAIQASDPFAVLIESVRAVVREELATALARPAEGNAAERPTLSVRQCADATVLGEDAIRRVLAEHPELKIRAGTKLLVRWPEFRAWLTNQQRIPGDSRPRRPPPRTSASRRKGGE